LIGDDGQNGPFEGVQFSDVLLRAVVAVPEIGRAHFRVHGLDFTLLLIAVKETSIDARRAS
jgi:hypothetical protein